MSRSASGISSSITHKSGINLLPSSLKIFLKVLLYYQYLAAIFFAIWCSRHQETAFAPEARSVSAFFNALDEYRTRNRIALFNHQRPQNHPLDSLFGASDCTSISAARRGSIIGLIPPAYSLVSEDSGICERMNVPVPRATSSPFCIDQTVHQQQTRRRLPLTQRPSAVTLLDFSGLGEQHIERSREQKRVRHQTVRQHKKQHHRAF